MNPFKTGDEAYILDKKVKVLDASGRDTMTDKGYYPFEVLSFTPYTAQGITHERPKLKPAGMFWDEGNNYTIYGVLISEDKDEKCSFKCHDGGWFVNFQEMTFDEYRKLKGL